MKSSSYVIRSLSFLLLLMLVTGCAPIFSEMQSARTVGKNNVDATASFSSVSFSADRESGHAQNHLDLQAAYGLSDAVDLRVRYSVVWVDDETDNLSVNVLGFGPKFSLVKDRLAGDPPLGFAFGSEVENVSDTWQFHPTLLGTVPIVERLDFNPSVKVLVPFESGAATLVALNVGLGFELTEQFTLRPEYGMLFNPGEEGHYRHFSIGVTFMPWRSAAEE